MGQSYSLTRKLATIHRSGNANADAHCNTKEGLDPLESGDTSSASQTSQSTADGLANATETNASEGDLTEDRESDVVSSGSSTGSGDGRDAAKQNSTINVRKEPLEEREHKVGLRKRIHCLRPISRLVICPNHPPFLPNHSPC
jgi:hypothetical protein